ncbi:Beta-lactamase family protein [Frankia sp. AgKG'84/4]
MFIVRRHRPRRRGPAIGAAPGLGVLAAAFGPLVPRRLAGLVAVAADQDGTHEWSAGTWRTLHATGATAAAGGGGGGGGNDAPAVFQLASITKVFTAVLLADAVAAGLVRLDQPVEELLAAPLRVGGAPVTLRHLATHRAGLPFLPESAPDEPDFDPRDPYRTYDADRLVAAATAAATRDHVRPGRRPPQRYSNFGFALLGLALARGYGTSYEQALHERILAPAGLTDTSLRPSRPRAVHTDEHGEIIRPQEFAAFGPAGGLWTTAADLARWLTLLTESVTTDTTGATGTTADPEARPTADRRRVRDLVRTTMAPQVGTNRSGLGLAWWLSARHGLASHGGGVPGSSSYLAVDQNHATAVGVLALGNSGEHLDLAARRALTGR